MKILLFVFAILFASFKLTLSEVLQMVYHKEKGQAPFNYCGVNLPNE